MVRRSADQDRLATPLDPGLDRFTSLPHRLPINTDSEPDMPRTSRPGYGLRWHYITPPPSVPVSFSVSKRHRKSEPDMGRVFLPIAQHTYSSGPRRHWPRTPVRKRRGCSFASRRCLSFLVLTSNWEQRPPPLSSQSHLSPHRIAVSTPNPHFSLVI
ncbi:hypothetical protein K438DRAFT_1962673 [Mycena galopus ATCC 62051]|nr:hypothetical protein K438DRAFT_1962673 [Mycena galopus ATCC 62051]